MQRMIAVLALLAQALFLSACAVTGGVNNPLARLQDAPCASKQRVSLGSVIACRRVYVEQDIWDSRGLPALTTALEQAGVRVLRNRPWNSGPEREVDYVVIRMRSSSIGYGNNCRVRIEVRDADDALLYYNEEVIPNWHFWNDLPGVTERMCPVHPIRCP